MNTPIHNILITINATAEQLSATDALYEIIGPELKKDEELKYKFNTFFHSKLSGVDLIDAFAKVMQPAIARLANSLGETLSLPLYASLAKHITTEWVQAPDAVLGARMTLVEGDPIKNSMVQGSVADTMQDPFLAGIEAKREDGMPAAIAAPYGAQTLVGDPHEALTFDVDPNAARAALPMLQNWHTDPGPLARGSAGQDRSRPVLNGRVLRGFESLVAKLQVSETGHAKALAGLTKGDREARVALKYMERMVAWGKEHDRM